VEAQIDLLMQVWETEKHRCTWITFALKHD